MTCLNLFFSFNRYLANIGCTESRLFVSEAQEYIANSIDLSIVTKIETVIDSALNSQQHEAVNWAFALSNDAFYTGLVRSAATSEYRDISLAGFSCRHSLTSDYETWLVGYHEYLGRILILQSNYACEAVFFDDLSCYVIMPQGIGQLRALANLMGQSQWPDNITQIHNYLSSDSLFAGINYSYPSPFHNITFGHTSLASLHLNGISSHLHAYIKKGNIWFDPRRLFPTIISKVDEFEFTGRFIELSGENPVFMFKLGHLYRTAAAENRILDIALLSSSSASALDTSLLNETFRESRGIRIWIGLTSGKRSLVNEVEIIECALAVISSEYTVGCVVIDGWTGSSLFKECHSGVQDKIDAIYSDHDQQAEHLCSLIAQKHPSVTTTSIVGRTYEEKVAIALGCNLSITSAYTSSVVPSRIASLHGIVHTSNAGRSTLNMHIWKNAKMVPEDIVHDVASADEQLNPLDKSYLINPALFSAWFQDYLSSIPRLRYA